MKRIVLFCSFLIILALFLAAATAHALTIPQAPEPPTPPERPTDRLIIKFKDSVSTADRTRFFDSHQLSQSNKLRSPRVYSAKFSRGTAADLVSSLRGNAEIEYVEPDSIATKVEVPNDPMIGSQWGLAKIQSFAAWDTTHGSESVTIAVLDTGVDGAHSDVGANISARANFTNVADGDRDGHGTHVAGVAAAVTNNGIGIAGVGYTSRIMSVKVLDDSGSGYYSWIANGIYWAADNGAAVINLSLGGTSPSMALRNAVQYAWDKGTVVVAAAGNNNSKRAFYPAYYTPAIAVGATDQNDKKASFSNYGTWVHVAAPGVSILSTYQGNYGTMSGTSMATPFVSGLAALVKGGNPGWTNAQVVSKIESSADHVTGTGTYWAFGRINACRALDCTSVIVTPTPTPPAGGTPTRTPTPTPPAEPDPTPQETPTPTPSGKPWWCIYVPTNRYCI